MPSLRISEVAALLAVSDDTVRRWVSAGQLPTTRDSSGRAVIDGAAVAAWARARLMEVEGGSSARNRLPGIVTRVEVDGVMAQVEIAAGRFRVVSLMSREAAEQLELAPGVLATAVVKATIVMVEIDR